MFHKAFETDINYISFIIFEWVGTLYLHNVKLRHSLDFLRIPRPGVDPGGEAIEAIVPLKPTKVTLFIMILNNSENSIRDIRLFCRLLLYHGSVVKYTSSLFQ